MDDSSFGSNHEEFLASLSGSQGSEADFESEGFFLSHDEIKGPPSASSSADLEQIMNLDGFPLSFLDDPPPHQPHQGEYHQETLGNPEYREVKEEGEENPSEEQGGGEVEVEAKGGGGGGGEDYENPLQPLFETEGGEQPQDVGYAYSGFESSPFLESESDHSNPSELYSSEPTEEQQQQQQQEQLQRQTRHEEQIDWMNLENPTLSSSSSSWASPSASQPSKPVKDMNEAELQEYLRSKEIPEDIIQLLKEQRYTGSSFLEIKRQDLKAYGIHDGPRKVINFLIRENRPSPPKSSPPSTLPQLYPQPMYPQFRPIFPNPVMQMQHLHQEPNFFQFPPTFQFGNSKRKADDEDISESAKRSKLSVKSNGASSSRVPESELVKWRKPTEAAYREMQAFFANYQLRGKEKCPVEKCTYATKTKKELITHINSKHLRFKIYCNQPGCLKYFFSQRVKRIHLKEAHGISEDNSIIIQSVTFPEVDPLDFLTASDPTSTVAADFTFNTSDQSFLTDSSSSSSPMRYTEEQLFESPQAARRSRTMTEAQTPFKTLGAAANEIQGASDFSVLTESSLSSISLTSEQLLRHAAPSKESKSRSKRPAFFVIFLFALLMMPFLPFSPKNVKEFTLQGPKRVLSSFRAYSNLDSPFLRETNNLGPRPQFFVGREHELDLLSQRVFGHLSPLQHSHLHNNSTSPPPGEPPVSVVVGSRQVGKKILVSEFAYSHLGEFKTVWWLRSSPEMFVTEVKNLMRDYFALHTKENDRAQVLKIFHKILRQKKYHPCLLIFSSADPTEDFSSFLPSEGVYAILTSNTLGNFPKAAEIPLAPFGQEEFLMFFEDMITEEPGRTRKLAGELGEHLRQQPIALSLASSYLKYTKAPFSQYLDAIKRLKQQAGGKEVTPLDIAWRITRAELERIDPFATRIAEVAAHFDSNMLPYSWFEPLWASPLAVQPASLHLLSSFDILHLDTNALTFSVHPRLQYAMRKLQKETRRLDFHHEAVQILMKRLLKFSMHRAEFWKDVDIAAKQASTLLLNHDMPLEAEEIACLSRILGEYYMKVKGDAHVANRMFLRSHSASLQLHPDGLSEMSALALSFLGIIEADEGNITKATGFMSKAEELATLIFPEDTRIAEAVVTYSNLGAFHTSLGTRSKALPFLTRALDVCRRIYGEGSLSEVEILGLLGQYHRRDDVQESLILYQEALRILDSESGVKDSFVRTDILNSLGVALRDLGKNDLAAEYLNETLAETVRLLGTTMHVDVVILDMNLLILLLDMGRQEEALVHLQRGYSNVKALKGNHSHPDVGLAEYCFGRFLLEQEREKESIERFSRAQQIFGEAFGTEQDMYHIVSSYLGFSLVKLKDLQQGYFWLNNSMGHFEKNSGDTLKLATVHYLYGEALGTEGDDQGAQENFAYAYEMLSKKHSENVMNLKLKKKLALQIDDV